MAIIHKLLNTVTLLLSIWVDLAGFIGMKMLDFKNLHACAVESKFTRICTMRLYSDPVQVSCTFHKQINLKNNLSTGSKASYVRTCAITLNF